MPQTHSHSQKIDAHRAKAHGRKLKLPPVCGGVFHRVHFGSSVADTATATAAKSKKLHITLVRLPRVIKVTASIQEQVPEMTFMTPASQRLYLRSAQRISRNRVRLQFLDASFSLNIRLLRYLVDPAYAAEMDSALKKLQFSREELQEMARDNPMPLDLFAPSGQDLISDSWK
jgi:hypothetical protein